MIPTGRKGENDNNNKSNTTNNNNAYLKGLCITQLKLNVNQYLTNDINDKPAPGRPIMTNILISVHVLCWKGVASVLLVPPNKIEIHRLATCQKNRSLWAPVKDLTFIYQPFIITFDFIDSSNILFDCSITCLMDCSSILHPNKSV